MAEKSKTCNYETKTDAEKVWHKRLIGSIEFTVASNGSE